MIPGRNGGVILGMVTSIIYLQNCLENFHCFGRKTWGVRLMRALRSMKSIV